jgi:hypothetical protein
VLTKQSTAAQLLTAVLQDTQVQLFAVVETYTKLTKHIHVTTQVQPAHIAATQHKTNYLQTVLQVKSAQAVAALTKI